MFRLVQLRKISLFIVMAVILVLNLPQRALADGPRFPKVWTISLEFSEIPHKGIAFRERDTCSHRGHSGFNCSLISRKVNIILCYENARMAGTPPREVASLTALRIASATTSAAKLLTATSLASISPVASAKIVSPSNIVCVGRIA